MSCRSSPISKPTTPPSPASTSSSQRVASRPISSFDGEFVFFLARGDAPVRDVEPVEDVPPVAGVDGLPDAVGVVAEAQVRREAEVAHRVDVDHDRTGGDRGNALLEVQLVLQQRQLVGEQDRVAAGDELHPVADVEDVVDDLKARTIGGRAAALGAGGLARSAGALRGNSIEEIPTASGSWSNTDSDWRASVWSVPRSRISPRRISPSVPIMASTWSTMSIMLRTALKNSSGISE